MSDRFRVGRFPEEIWLVRRDRAGAAPSGAVPVSGTAAALSVESWIPRGSMGRLTLVAVVESALGSVRSNPHVPEDRLRSHVQRALRDGTLQAFRVNHEVTPGGKKVDPNPAPPPQPTPVDDKTWVEIVLFDEENPPKPVPFVKYKIELPDGSTREGNLDANGIARFAGIDPGSCKVSFPTLHGDDWQAA